MRLSTTTSSVGNLTPLGPLFSPEGGTSLPSCVSRSTAILKHRDAEGTEFLRLPTLRVLRASVFPILLMRSKPGYRRQTPHGFIRAPNRINSSTAILKHRDAEGTEFLRLPTLRVLRASVFPILLMRSKPRYRRQTPQRFIRAPNGTNSLNRSMGSRAVHAIARRITVRKIGSSNVQL